jgi:hypothetical protein
MALAQQTCLRIAPALSGGAEMHRNQRQVLQLGQQRRQVLILGLQQNRARRWREA